MFSNDNQMLVLNPIERMINFMIKVIKNPLEINKIKEDIDNMNEDKEPEVDKDSCWEKVRTKFTGTTKTAVKDKLDIKDQFETKILESSIQKLCNLLVQGIGKAGQDIIIRNIGNNNAINTYMKGTKIEAIFGYVNIKNFHVSLKAFDQEIMIVVNTII